MFCLGKGIQATKEKRNGKRRKKTLTALERNQRIKVEIQAKLALHTTRV